MVALSDFSKSLFHSKLYIVLCKSITYYISHWKANCCRLLNLPQKSHWHLTVALSADFIQSLARSVCSLYAVSKQLSRSFIYSNGSLCSIVQMSSGQLRRNSFPQTPLRQPDLHKAGGFSEVSRKLSAGCFYESLYQKSPLWLRHTHVNSTMHTKELLQILLDSACFDSSYWTNVIL